MRSHALQSAGCIVCITLVTSLVPAAAKDVRIAPYVAPTVDAPLTPEESAVLARSLNVDAATLAAATPDRSFSTSSIAHPSRLDVSRSEHADGSSTVTVKQPLSADWDAKVGADLAVAATPAPTYEPDKPLPGTAKENASGAAWASLGVTRFATVDARVAPGNEQAKLGATIEHSIALGDNVSVTLRGRYAVSDALAAPPVTAQQPAPVLSNDQAVKLNIASTGTTLSAGVRADSTDPATHNTLSADQKVSGPLHVTTVITDPGQQTSSRSVTARFKWTW